MGKSAFFSVILPVLLVLITAAGTTCWLVHQADLEMRESLLKQAQTVAQTVSTERIKALSGSRADLDSPDYLAVKQQLVTVQKTLEKCRFVYLAGRQSDGTVFFFADSEPVNSRDYSPPGQVYEEAPEAFLRVFDTRTSLTEGPYSDRWGTWITALVPLTDPANGNWVAVLGLDIDARTWRWEILAHAALPAGSTLAVLILLASWLIATHRQADTSIKPIQRRLMIPLATILLLLVGGFGALLLKQQRDSLNQSSEKMLAEVSNNFRTLTNEQSRTLAALGQTLLRDTTLRESLKKGDRERLMADYGPVFKQFQVEQNLTHFYFFQPDRICLLRVHKPEKYGDKINSFTLLEAERTGQTVSGLELGPLGTFTLRLVIPVRDGDTLIGYLELGREIEDTLKTLHAQDGFEVALTIHKNNLNQADWETGMKMLGREADWNRFAEDTVIYSSLPQFPLEVERFVGEQGHTHGDVLAKTTFNGHSWQVMATPLKDVSGAEVGDLFLLQDITDLQTMQNRLVTVGIGGMLVLLTGLFGFLFVLLRHTDQSIQMQQRELVAREERHRSMFERNRCVQLLIDPRNGAILDTNSAACAFYGYTLEQMRQMKMSAINLLSEEEILRQMEAARVEQQYFFRFQHRLANGQIRDVEVYSSPIPFGEHDLIYAIIHDITDRKRAEEALRAEEARLRAITESARDAILMMDPAGNISFWNPAAERIFGYSSAEILGRNLHTLLVPERYHATHQEAFTRFRATGQGDVVGKSVELEACHKDGREISVELSLSALRLADGWHSVGILRDITARKQAEEAMREMNLALERQTLFSKEMASEAQMASAAKSEFLANMSHEIRTPMNGVIGMTGLLLDTDLTDEQRRYAQTVRSCGESLLSLINDILDFSKIEAKKLDLETLDFDLQNVLDDFAATMALRAHDKGLELICAADPNVPSRLRGDPGRLRQILTNLAGNALKFTQRGEVAIRAALESETREDVLLRFTIRDTGIGIPPDKIAQIFDKFTQADSSTTRKYGGTGLGLAISKQLSELMGGEIGVESTEGVGTEFWFTVRLRKQPEGASAERLTPTDLHNIRILIVDDNATSREILTTRTRSWGMRPSEASEGTQALQLLQEAREAGDPFRIAVIDMQMPGMDGEMLGKTIRADVRLAETRLVLLTSLGTRGDAHHFQEIGFSAYLTKPARNQELYGVLSLALAERDPDRPQPIVTRHSTQNLLQLPATASVRILLAEDNIINQQVALGILKKFGLRADAVANGVEAVKALETLPYDIVLMDVQMPVMDGLEATRQVRNPGSGVLDHTLPIIAMTAHTMQGDREQCLAAGMNDYVSKPVTPRALAEVLGKWIPREKGEDEVKREESESRQAPSPETPVWDKAGMFERLMEDEELAEEIVATFLEDIPRQIQILETLLDAGDIPGVRRQAHSIKGASANIGGERLRAVAFTMEKTVSEGDLATTEKHLPELKAQFERLRDTIQANSTWASQEGEEHRCRS
jgi:PAS domain S-box-containing protein